MESEISPIDIPPATVSVTVPKPHSQQLTTTLFAACTNVNKSESVS